LNNKWLPIKEEVAYKKTISTKKIIEFKKYVYFYTKGNASRNKLKEMQGLEEMREDDL
jgi:hypothetical protein